MKINKETLVSDIVARNYKSASVFKKHKIDFCCQGNRSLDTVCVTNDIHIDDLIEELKNSFTTEKDTNDYWAWGIDFLSDYIYNNHHCYVENKIPEIKQYLNKICEVHGARHPELFEIKDLFKASASELTMHMKKEELILFPYFKKLAKAIKGEEVSYPTSFTSVKSLIAMMHQEHDNEGHRFRKIAELSNHYTPSKDACSTYKVTFSMLQEFEEDLHKHIQFGE